MYRHFFKRFFDIIFSLLAIIVLAVPMTVIAIVVKCDSKGPALFRTVRVGKNGKPFKFYKFRSMRTTAPEDCAPRLLHSEEYITKVGAFLRKTSLDELPQLFCILKGDMSLIGPRPCGFSEEDLIAERNKYGVYAVRPGLTGLAQVSGRDVLASHIERKAWFDGEYVKKITLWGDVKIFFRTIKAVFEETDVVEGDAVLKEEENQENKEVAKVALEAAVAEASNSENDGAAV